MKKSRLTILAAAAVLAAVSLASSCRKVSLGDIDALTGRVDNVELELAGIDDQIAGIGTTIANLRTVVDALQASSASSSAQAQAALEARIAALEQLQESLATRDWAEGTFATLAAQQQTAATLAGVQAAVSAALAGMPEGKTVTEAIADASQSVQGWVNTQLAGYCTIGTIEGKLSAMKTELEAQTTALDGKVDSLDAALTAKIEAAKTSIDSLGTALENARTAITTAYTVAINAAKTELDGKITANTTAITAANASISTLEGQVTTLETNVDALQTALTAVQARLDKLETMVQSVVFVPKYEGGCAVVRTTSDLNSLTLEYEVFPQTCASAIATAWASDNSILALNSRSVLTRSALASIPITGVAYNSGSNLLEVSVKLNGVAGVALSSGAALAVSLTINTGATTVSSPFSDIVMPRIVDLSAGGTANCYIVKEAGEYKFNATVRGNGKKTDGTDADAIALTGATAQVLWESFGTADTPAAGSLVNSAVLDGNNVLFSATSNTGNAVIAVKDADGNILWSWHIWLAGELPQDQVYNNGAGTMMDRNLGATSATPSDGVKTFGLLYQWGRKDPFLGCSATSGTTVAKSYPDNIHSADAASSHLESNTTLDFSISNPTVFLTNGSTPYDWYCTEDTNKNDNLWKSSDASSPKTMYDPCPAGWRVPDGGDTGVWYKAFSSSSWTTATNWDSTYLGMDFGRTDKKLGSGMIWYPAAGYRHDSDGTLNDVGSGGRYWSCTPYGTDAYYLLFLNDGSVYPSDDDYRAGGCSVRCLSESR